MDLTLGVQGILPGSQCRVAPGKGVNEGTWRRNPAPKYFPTLIGYQRSTLTVIKELSVLEKVIWQDF